MKYQLLKQWPIVSADLPSDKDLIDFDINLNVKRIEALDGLEDRMENVHLQKDN